MPKQDNKTAPATPAAGKLRTIRRALVLVWHGARLWTIGGIVLLPIQAVLSTLPLYLSKLIVDSVASAVRGGDRTRAIHQVTATIAMQALVMVLGAVVSALAG